MTNKNDFIHLYQLNKELEASGKPDASMQGKLCQIGPLLSWQELLEVRSELESGWATPKWYVPGSGDKPDRQKENYYASILMSGLAKLQDTSYVLLGRPDQQNATNDPTQETHDFEYREVTGKIVALEVTRLLEEEGVSIAHPRKVNDLIKFWKGVEGNSVKGSFLVNHCSLLPNNFKDVKRQNLVAELKENMDKMYVGESQTLQTEPLIGTTITKSSNESNTIELIGFWEPSRPIWESNRVVNYFFNKTLNEKNAVLQKAKQKGKTTILLICLDYPFADLSALSQRMAQEAQKIQYIDEIYSVSIWDGFPGDQLRHLYSINKGSSQDTDTMTC